MRVFEEPRVVDVDQAGVVVVTEGARDGELVAAELDGVEREEHRSIHHVIGQRAAGDDFEPALARGLGELALAP